MAGESPDETRARLVAECNYLRDQLAASRRSYDSEVSRCRFHTARWLEAARVVSQLNAALRRKNAYIKRLRARLASDTTGSSGTPVSEE